MAYEYVVSTGPTATGPWTQFGPDVTVTTDTITGLTAGTTYFFQVVPVDLITGASGPAKVVGPLTTAASLSVSPDGTTITSAGGTGGGAGQIVDNNLVAWTLVPSTSFGTQIKHATFQDSANVQLLLFFGGKVYQQNTTNNWAVWSDTTKTYSTVSGDPRFSPSASDSNITFAQQQAASPAFSLILVDNTGVRYGMNASQQITVNGNADTGTTGVQDLAWINNVMWYQGPNVGGTAGPWFSKTSSTSPWSTPQSIVNPFKAEQTITNVVLTPASPGLNQTFLVTGTLNHYVIDTISSMLYADDGGSTLQINLANQTKTTFTFTHPGMPAYGSHTLALADPNNPQTFVSIPYTMTPLANLAITGLTVSVPTAGVVTVAWTAVPVSGVTYAVQSSIDKVTWIKSDFTIVGGASSVSMTGPTKATTFVTNTGYFFQVYAITAGGTGALSAPVPATPFGNKLPPATFVTNAFLDLELSPPLYIEIKSDQTGVPQPINVTVTVATSAGGPFTPLINSTYPSSKTDLIYNVGNLPSS